MIFIAVKFSSRPDVADQWLARVAPFTAATRVEPGNLFFEWLRSVGTAEPVRAAGGLPGPHCRRGARALGALPGSHGVDARCGRGDAGDYPRRSARRRLGLPPSTPHGPAAAASRGTPRTDR